MNSYVSYRSASIRLFVREIENPKILDFVGRFSRPILPAWIERKKSLDSFAVLLVIRVEMVSVSGEKEKLKWI